MISIGKHFEFEASHQLPGELYGKCQHLHGHTYRLTVEVAGPVGPDGWICNFADVKRAVMQRVVERLDHQHLNDFFTMPTAENVLLWIVAQLVGALPSGVLLSRCRLYETSTSYAEWIP